MTDRNSRVTCSGEWASNNCGSRGPSTLPASSSAYKGVGGGGNNAENTPNMSAHVHYTRYVDYVTSARHVFSTQPLLQGQLSARGTYVYARSIRPLKKVINA